MINPKNCHMLTLSVIRIIWGHMSQSKEIFNSLSELGAGQDAIAAHYDLGNGFFELWLDKTMSYTAALWENPNDDLYTAQINKLNYALQSVKIGPNQRILDIGCGWGGMLQHALTHYQASAAVGITLSKEQKEWIDHHCPSVTCDLVNWHDYESAEAFDAIVSVEAIEAFVRPDISSEKRLAIYHKLFEKCHKLLKPGGCLYLQAICYGNKSPKDLDGFIKQEVFPDSDLPMIGELFTASQGLFEITDLKNDRLDYAKTLKEWQRNLRTSKAKILSDYDEAIYTRFRHYLKLSEFMFLNANCLLIRATFKRYF